MLDTAAAVLNGYQIRGDDLVDVIRFLLPRSTAMSRSRPPAAKMPRNNDLSYRRIGLLGLDLAFHRLAIHIERRTPPDSGTSGVDARSNAVRR